VKGIDIPRPFPRLTWDEAMSGYGCDKPDLRFDLKLRDVTEIARKHGGGGAGLVSETLEKGGVIKVLPVPSAHPLSRADVDRLEGQLKQLGSPGLARAKVEAAGWAQAGWARETAPGMRSEIEAACGAKPGDLLLFQFGAAKDVNQWLCALRLALGKKFGLMKDGVFAFCWVTEFPLLEYSEEEKKWTATHHPFTSPRISDLDRLESDPGSVKALAYDVVLNGFELGGGSIRIHDPALQSRMFGALGISREEARAKFGFLLEAFRYGPPPHGGIALGLDRLAMIISGAESLRDVIAFPKTARAVCLMTEAPSAVDPGQLDELGIAARPAKG
jgi:aspartyl-tRNA synthetase